MPVHYGHPKKNTVAKATHERISQVTGFTHTTNSQWPTLCTKSLARFHRINSYGF